MSMFSLQSASAAMLCIAALCCPALAHAQEAVIAIDTPPDRLMVGEAYTFHVRVVNRSDRTVPLAVEFAAPDGDVSLQDVGIARAAADGATIARRTDGDTDTAICGWGEWRAGETARCAFRLAATGSGVAPVVFAIRARNADSGEILASHVFRYTVRPGLYITDSLHYFDHGLRSQCSHLLGGEGWTQAYADCYGQARDRSDGPVFPVPGLPFGKQAADPVAR